MCCLSWWALIEMTFLQEAWGGGGYQRLAPPLHVRWQTQVFYMQWMSFSRKFRANLNLSSTIYQDISAFYTETSCWPWALHVSLACNTLPPAHEAVHRKPGSRGGCKNHLQASMGEPPHPHPPFYFTIEPLQVPAHHCNAHCLTTLSFESQASGAQ